MIDWLHENDIIKKLYVNNVHVEILTRCKEIPRFLAEEEKLTKNDITIIWNAGIDKHESIVHVIYDSIGLISEMLKYDLIQHVFSLMRSIDYKNYDVPLFNLVRRFSISAINRNSQAPIPQYYGLEISYDLLQDGVTNNEIKKLAFVFIKDFLNWKECYSQRKVIIDKCLENLKNHSSTVTNLQILKIAIETYTPSINGDCISTIIVNLEEESSLLQLFFNDLVYYKKSRGEEEEEDSISEIKERLNFLEFIICSSTVTLSREQIDILWDVIINDVNSYEEQTIGNEWLQQIGDITKSFQPFSGEMYLYLFTEKFSTLDLQTASASNINLIVSYFEYINTLNCRLRYEQRNYIPLSFDLYGIDLLWRIIFECTMDISATKVIHYLINLLKKSPQSLASKVPEQGELYIQKCFCEIDNAISIENNELEPKDTLRVLRALNVLQVLSMIFSDKTKTVHGSINLGDPVSFIVGGLGVNRETFNIQMFLNEKLADLRSAIAKKIDVESFRIRLIVNNSSECKNFDSTLQEANIKDGVKVTYIINQAAVKKNNENEELFSPVTLLSKPEYFNRLFSLLSKEDTIASEVWELLLSLPTNEQLYNQLKNGPSSKSLEWSKLLDRSCIYKLLYILQIIDSLIQNPSNNNNNNNQLSSSIDSDTEKWCEWFLEDGGIYHFLQLLISDIWYESKLNDKHTSCLSKILKFICIFCIKNDNNNNNNNEKKDIDIDNDKKMIDNEEENNIEKKEELIINNEDKEIQKLIPYTDLDRFFTNESNITPQFFIQSITQLMYLTNKEKCCQLDILTDIISYGFRILVACCLNINECNTTFINLSNLEEWICSLILLSKEESIRDIAAIRLYELLGYINDKNIKFILFDKLLNILPNTYDICETAEQFYKLLEMLVKRFCEQNPNIASSDRFSNFFKSLFSSLKTRKIIEINSSIYDPVLSGIISLISTIFSYREDLKKRVGLEVAIEVFENCLFKIPDANTNNNPPPKCKNKLSRKVAYDLLLELSKDNIITWNSLVSGLSKHHSQCSVPNLWNYYPKNLVKSSSGYVGLQNLGATCYMNSLMQQLFMNPPFRYGILSVPDPEKKIRQSLIFQLKSMFGFLSESAKKYYETFPYCEAYGGDDFSPYIQMDADEYFNILFDKLEKITKDTPQESLLKDIYGGALCNRVISKECEHVSENREPFYTLSVAVKGKASLQESLELFVEGDILEGDNKYHCSKCDKKVTALKQYCIESLPNSLIIHMRRFEFDLEEMRRMKVNDYCSFPHELNLEEYTKEGLEKIQALSENRIPESPKRPQSYYNYKLSGILVHHGTAETGHYYSFIKENNSEEWFQFNDSNVDTFDRSDIPRQCYGGIDTPVKGFESSGSRSRNYNAYMLFYQRIKPIETKTNDILNNINLNQPIQENIYQRIWRDNRKFLRDTYIYDCDYFSFVYNALLNQDNLNSSIIIPYEDSLNINCPLFKCIHLGCQVVAQSLVHAKERSILPKYITLLKSQFSRHLPACIWFIKSLISNGWAELIFLKCTSEITRNSFCELVTLVISCLSNCEDSFYQQLDEEGAPLDIEDIEGDSPPTISDNNDLMITSSSSNEDMLNINISYVGQFFDSYIRFIPQLASHWRTFSQYFQLLKNFASLGNSEKQFLLSYSICTLLIDSFMLEESQVNNSKETEWTALPSKYLSKVNSTPLLELLYELINDSDYSDMIEESIDLKERLTKKDRQMLYLPDFYLRILSTQQDSNILTALLCKLLKYDDSFFQQIVDALISKLYHISRDQVENHCSLLKDFMFLNDKYQNNRIEYIVLEILKTISQDDEKSPFTTPIIIRILIDWIKQFDSIGMILFEQTNIWLLQWLILSDVDQTRDSCEVLVRTLIGNDFDEEQSELHSTIIFAALVEFIPCAKDHAVSSNYKNLGSSQNEYQSSPFKLTGYLRLLTLLTKTEQDVAPIMDNSELLLDLLQNGIDSKYIELDANKYEFLVFWNHLLDIDDSLVTFLTNLPDNRIRELINFYVCLRPQSEQCKEYNRKTMSLFYRLMYYCCKNSDRFLCILLEHNHFTWAVDSLFLSNLYYPVDEKIYSILCLGSDIFQEQVRTMYISRVLQANISHFSDNNALMLFDKFLQGEREHWEFCAANGPGRICQYSEMSEQNSIALLHHPENAEVILLGLNVLIKASTFLLDNEDGRKEQLINLWENKINMLSVIRNYLHCSHENILQSSFRLLYNIARLDNLFFENLIQCLCQEHENFNFRTVPVQKKLYSLEKPTKDPYLNRAHGSKHEGYYNFLSSICSCALETMFLDAQLIRNVLRLCKF